MIEPYEERNSFNVFWSTFVVRAGSYAALACLVWEWFLTLKYEVSIWQKSKGILYVKCLYSVSRYLGIAAQIINSVVVTHTHTSHDLPRSFCQAWQGVQLALGFCLLLPLEIILVTRLYALYDKSIRMSYFLVAVLFIEYIMVITCGIVSVRRAEFYNSCIPSKVPLTVMLIGAVEMGTQCILWGLTLYRHVTLRQGYGWQKVPLLSMVTRDGSWVSGVVILMLLRRDYPCKSGDCVISHSRRLS
ncbi:hypothetical protein BDQ12DRAFT_673035 [Crucibulum laeve]|uniref:DUF6533 domain-containing protein n=1 Tax=Crucibulum laeve TaxID=68775 RepID=A0A5C3MJ97_9AGAR|nr:hypothetical protein BDQ12DRAFT_673035 [Crucibulum laeve]